MAKGYVAITNSGIWGLGGTESEAKNQAWQLAPHCVHDRTFRTEPASTGALTVLARNPWTPNAGFSRAGVECLNGFWIRLRLEDDQVLRERPKPQVFRPRRGTTAAIQLARLRLEAAALEYAPECTARSQAALLEAARTFSDAVRLADSAAEREEKRQ